MRITRPEHCAIVIGIPLTQQEYIEAHDDRSHRDLAQRQGPWLRYQRQVSQPFEKVARQLFSLNVTVVRHATLNDFHNTFDKPHISTVILVSHWQKNTVEFFDGMRSIADVTRGIPIHFNGVLDICVCHPLGLAKLVRELRPNCLVRLTNIEVKPVIWFQFYRLVFRYLATEQLSYLDALERSLTLFLNLEERS